MLKILAVIVAIIFINKYAIDPFMDDLYWEFMNMEDDDRREEDR